MEGAGALGYAMDFNVIDNMLLLSEKLKELRQAKAKGKILPQEPPKKKKRKKKQR